MITDNYFHMGYSPKVEYANADTPDEIMGTLNTIFWENINEIIFRPDFITYISGITKQYNRPHNITDSNIHREDICRKSRRVIHKKPIYIL